jgi:hypothetical protein
MKQNHSNNGKPGLMSYEQLHELLQMTALQTVENTKRIEASRRGWKKELRESHAIHVREMKEIRIEFKKMIQRIAV